MIVQRLAESRDERAPYTRMATAEANMRDLLAEHGVQATAVRARWAPSSEHDVLLEVWVGTRAAVVRP